MTGNGLFNANSGGSSYGDSFVKLKLEGNTLAIKDYFTPCNRAQLDRTCGNEGRCDLDLGSAGPLLVSGTSPNWSLLIGGGKDGNIYGHTSFWSVESGYSSRRPWGSSPTHQPARRKSRFI
jgi:hypothetical protein